MRISRSFREIFYYFNNIVQHKLLILPMFLQINDTRFNNLLANLFGILFLPDQVHDCHMESSWSLPMPKS